MPTAGIGPFGDAFVSAPRSLQDTRRGSSKMPDKYFDPLMVSERVPTILTAVVRAGCGARHEAFASAVNDASY